MTRKPFLLRLPVTVGAFAAVALAATTIASAATKIRQHPQGGPLDRVTLEIDGPALHEATGPNPFADYALDVTFSDGQKSVTVPGYFAGCSDATRSSCTGGRTWKAHFLPDHGGKWRYTLRFRTGKDIVPEGGEGAAVTGDGTSGEFQVGTQPRNAVRARGLLQYTGDNYYRWSGTKDVFFKFGADSPENFLAAADFDATPDYKGFRKTWALHVRDFDAAQAGKYTFNGGKGKGLLGALRYLDSEGMNSVSMLLFNVGGDDRNVVPQLIKVPLDKYATMEPKQQWDEGVVHDRYDLSKLAQWQKVLDYGDELGLHLHFKLQETENDRFMDGGALGRERKIYMREMVARFGHYLALTWNLGEENEQTTRDEIDQANYMGKLNVYSHPLVMHTYPHAHERYRPMLGSASALNGASIQGGTTDFTDMRSDIIKWSSLSRAAGRPWVIGYDEQGGAQGGAPVDDDYPAAQLPQELNEKTPTRETFRRGAIWNVFTAGAAGLEVYYGYRTGCTDLNCQDHRTRAAIWKDARVALDFFRKVVGNQALKMVADDDLTFYRNDYVFAELGRLYVIYAATSGITNPTGGPPPEGNPRRPRFALQTFGYPGRYSVEWYDALNGGELRKGSVTEIEGGKYASLGEPPAGGSGEWAIVVRRID